MLTSTHAAVQNAVEAIMGSSSSKDKATKGKATTVKKRTIHDIEHGNDNPRSQQRTKLDLGNVDMSDGEQQQSIRSFNTRAHSTQPPSPLASTEFTWSAYQQSIVDEDFVNVTHMPAMLALLAIMVDCVRQVNPNHSSLQPVLQAIADAPTFLNAPAVMQLLTQFQAIRPTNKYIRKGRELISTGRADEPVTLSDMVKSL